MPLFKRGDNPGLDRLTPNEKRKRDTAIREVMEAQARSPGRTLEDMNLEILARKAREETTEFLWPFLLGWELLEMGQFDNALRVLEDGKTKRPGDSRGAYAVATVYYTAANQARWPDGRWTKGKVSLGMALTQLYQNALREFREALGLAESGRDRRLIQSSIDAIELGLRERQSGGRA